MKASTLAQDYGRYLAEEVAQTPQPVRPGLPIAPKVKFEVFTAPKALLSFPQQTSTFEAYILTEVVQPFGLTKLVREIRVMFV